MNPNHKQIYDKTKWKRLRIGDKLRVSDVCWVTSSDDFNGPGVPCSDFWTGTKYVGPKKSGLYYYRKIVTPDYCQLELKTKQLGLENILWP